MRMLPSEPALLIDEHLVIADVHIGFESGFASGGICLGKESSARKSAQRILKMMKESKSDSLVLLGDIKSGTSKITGYEWRNVPQFFDELGDIDIILVPGNHDGNISRLVPDSVSISSQSGVIIDGVLLTHGHAMPSEKSSSAGIFMLIKIAYSHSGDSCLVCGQAHLSDGLFWHRAVSLRKGLLQYALWHTNEQIPSGAEMQLSVKASQF